MINLRNLMELCCMRDQIYEDIMKNCEPTKESNKIRNFIIQRTLLLAGYIYYNESAATLYPLNEELPCKPGLYSFFTSSLKNNV